MVGYEVEPWHDLFVAVAGAAAALGGFFFVAVSLNVSQILEVKTLPPVAARSLAIVLGLLLLSLLGLTPGQSRTALGWEITALGLIMVVGLALSAARTHRHARNWRWTLATIALALISTLPMAVAGLSLVAGTGGGLYWTVVEMITGFTVAFYYSWILLIEIRR